MKKIANSQHSGEIPDTNSSHSENQNGLRISLGKKNTEQPQKEHVVKQPESRMQKSPSHLDGPHAVNKREKELESTIQKLKAENRKRMEMLIKKHMAERKLLQKKLQDQAGKDKESYTRELGQMKKNYQDQLEHIRQIYHTQNIEMQNGLKDAFESRITDMKKIYENTKSKNSDDRLEKLQRWLHDELISGQLQKTTSQLEQTKAFYDFEINKLIQQLDEKDEDITFLEDKIKEIAEEYLPENVQMEIFDELGLDEEELEHNEIDDTASERMKEQQK